MLFQAYCKTKTIRKKNLNNLQYMDSALKYNFMFDNLCNYSKREDIVLIGTPEDDFNGLEENDEDSDW